MELSDAIGVVAELVRDAGDITGAQLSRALKARLPDFSPRNHKAASLRVFIAQHVPAVVVAGRAGLDPIYRWNELPALPATSSQRPNFWQTWVSPNAPFALVIDREHGDVETCARGTNPGAGKMRLDSPSVGFHRQLAIDFLDHRPRTADIDTLRTLAEDEEQGSWWQPWFAAVRKMGLGTEWHLYRITRLREALENQLAQAALPHTAVEKALSIVLPPASHAQPAVPADPSVKQKSESALQRIVIAAVRRMTDDELRELKLPLGVVVDATGTSR